MPKGPPTEQGPNRLAVPTEDHPLEYASFAGEIAAGEYGGGSVTIWDAGRYATEKWDERHIIVTFDGRRLAGRYALFPVDDEGVEHPQAGRDAAPRPGPDAPLPMLATAGELPPAEEDARWGYEFKWDGVRAVAAVHGGVLALTSRKGTDITVRYPELAKLPGDARRARRGGRRRDRRHGRRRPPRLRRAAEPDAPHRARGAPDGRREAGHLPRLRPAVLGRRGPARRALRRAPGAAGRPGHRREPLGGHAVVPRGRGRRARRQPGERARGRRRQAARPRPTARALRSPDWRKVKNFRSQAVVVGGWRPGQGRRAGGIGSLLFGVPDDEGRLVYAGHVGTGLHRPGPGGPASGC